MTETPDIGKLLNSIVKEVGFLEREWALFSSIYFLPKRAKAFHHVLPVSYNIIALALQRDMVLIIARLFDPAKSHVKDGVRDNVSIPALLKVAGIDIDGLDPEERLATAYSSCKQYCDRLRDGHTKLIKHLDANVLIGGEKSEAPRREKAGEAIEALKALLDAIAAHLDRPRRRWEWCGAEDVHSEVTAFFEQPIASNSSHRTSERGLVYE